MEGDRLRGRTKEVSKAVRRELGGENSLKYGRVKKTFWKTGTNKIRQDRIR